MCEQAGGGTRLRLEKLKNHQNRLVSPEDNLWFCRKTPINNRVDRVDKQISKAIKKKRQYILNTSSGLWRHSIVTSIVCSFMQY